MRQIDLGKLSFPKNTNMNLLTQVLTEREVVKLLNFFADRPPEERIIRLPRRKVILKAICFFYGEQVSLGKMTWDEVVKELEIRFGNLAAVGLSEKEIKRLFDQRTKEIRKGK